MDTLYVKASNFKKGQIIIILHPPPPPHPNPPSIVFGSRIAYMSEPYTRN